MTLTDYLQLRYKLLPYIYGSAMRCVEESLPMIMALVIEYQDDENVKGIFDQYLFGDSLMVAPIFDEGTKRKVYLPKGMWTYWWTGERIKGNQWIDVEADIATIPLYIREGAIIPMCQFMNYVDEFRTEKIDLIISLFENENSKSFKTTVNGDLVTVEYKYCDGKHIVSIDKSDVEFNVISYGSGSVELVSSE